MGRLVSIVLVTWDSAAVLPRCLSAIAQQTWRDVELIVVDNASADDSLRIIAREAASALVIRNDRNAGFSRAVNQAIARAAGDFILLLNPDAFLEPDYVERLVTALDEAGEDFGGATGRLMRADPLTLETTPVIDSLGIRMTRSGRHLDIGQGRRLGAGGWRVEAPPAASHQPPAPEVFGVSGAAAMFRMAMVRDVSIDGEFLDEDFFAYREDADVAWRARIFGWRALCVPDAVAAHVRRVTPERRRSLSPAINMHSVKNRFLLRLKNEGAYLALRNAPFELGRDLVTIAAVLTIERTSLPALAWLWRHRARVIAKRRAVQSRRRVSDRALAGWFR
jgi:GT2 family glycosyltransferase